jgi:hypothetical protein
VERGVPQSSGNPATSRIVGEEDGVKKTPAKASTKNNGAPATTARRSGPVDPRTEDSTASGGVPRPTKSMLRRAGASLRSTLSADTGEPVRSPADFAASLPLARSTERPAGQNAETRLDLTMLSEPSAPTIDAQPALPDTALAPTQPVEPPPTESLKEPLVEPPPTLAAPILYDQAATIDDVTMIGPVLEPRPLRRPIHFRRAPRPRVRRVTRVVRHVDTWSVFKVSLVFNLFFYAVSLISGVLLWQVAYATGTIDNVEKFFEGFGWETFKFNGGQIYHNAWIAGLFVAMGLTGFAVLVATMFNLITDLVGGIRLSVLEEEVRPREERGTAPAPAAVEPMVDDATALAVVPNQPSDTMPVESS